MVSGWRWNLNEHWAYICSTHFQNYALIGTRYEVMRAREDALDIPVDVLSAEPSDGAVGGAAQAVMVSVAE